MRTVIRFDVFEGRIRDGMSPKTFGRVTNRRRSCLNSGAALARREEVRDPFAPYRVKEARVPLSRYLTAMFIGGASLLLYCGSAFAAPPPAKETSSGTHTQNWDSLSMSTLAAPPPKETSSGTSFQNWDRKLAGTLARFSLLADLTTRPVPDNETGFVWKKRPGGEAQANWASAASYCLGKPVGNQRGWRLFFDALKGNGNLLTIREPITLHHFPKMERQGSANELRDHGYRGAIILLSGSSMMPGLKEAYASGIVRVIPIPALAKGRYLLGELQAAITSCMQEIHAR